MKRLLPLIAILSTMLASCAPALVPTPLSAAAQIPTATATLTLSPTAVAAPIRTVTEIPTLASSPPTTVPTQEAKQTSTATRQTDNFPVSCAVPGTQKIGYGFFDLQSRTVTFCLPDLASMDACEPHNLEYCHCNSTSGCCQKPRGDELAVGDQTVTLHYPAGTTSFQASIPPACRAHNSDRVLIMGFANPLP